jgi:ribosomal protein S13
MKKIVRLTESELKNIVEASVKRSIKEGVITEEMLNEGIKDKAIELAKLAGVSVAVAASWLLAMGFGAFDNDPFIKAGDNQQQKEMNQQVKDGLGADVLDPDTVKFEGKIARAITESIRNLMNETSYDTISSAADNAEIKAEKMAREYGRNSYVAAKARRQLGNFKKKQADDFIAASDNRKATMQKNDKDRRDGKRTYKKGIGWRTDKA